ncbi:MAG TPA: serine/threonine-protein kinase, partial [Anaerolineales bacterium]|nr:serine/threonine-protein kinase [Anaerolineales bacterium]
MPAPSWNGQTIGGRYKIETLLGQGGMSAVYKGTDPNLRRTVAIKLIHPHLAADPEFVRRFEEEAAAVAQLRHPNIIQVHDFNHDGDTYFMVLEFVAGQSLQEQLKSFHATGKRLPLDETIRIMATVCDAVHYAHERGMIHRDLKPANVMINASGQPILMDFGVAKILGGQHHTATGAIVGTPTYISPEQVRGERPDHRADIYSLGVMLYEMISGRVPFDAETALSIMLKHLNDPVPNLHALNTDAPDSMIAIVDKALAKQPENRFESAHDMAAALRHVALARVAAAPPDRPTLGAPSPVKAQPTPSATKAAPSTPAPAPRST